jgi:cysteine desulfurase
VQVAAGGKPAGQPVYLDYNATTPVDPRVLESMLPYLDTHFGNPSSAHSFGLKPRAALERARAQVAALIGAAPAEILFTGSGSEADATAIRGVAAAAIRRGVGRPHVVTQATEHPAVLAACDYVRDHHGAEVTVLGVDARGLVDPRDLAAALRPETVLVLGHAVLSACPNLAASTGSACHAGTHRPSPVLAAMGWMRSGGWRRCA